MIITGHHTCAEKGDPKVIEAEGPFASQFIESDLKQHKFLGSGYYFWDDNIGMAHSFGEIIYKNKYYIFEAELNFADDDLLDLVGRRRDMQWFLDVTMKFQDNEETKTWGLGHWIEFLKRIGIFEYKAIRAVDQSKKPKEIMRFVENRENFTNLTPVFIVCLIDKTDGSIVSFKHIRTRKQHV